MPKQTQAPEGRVTGPNKIAQMEYATSKAAGLVVADLLIGALKVAFFVAGGAVIYVAIKLFTHIVNEVLGIDH